MVKIFIIYGGAEGLEYGTKINEHYKKNNLDSFLASRNSPDMTLGQDYQPQINENLMKSEIAIIVITPELANSPAAMDEIRQVREDLHIPFIPYERKDSGLPVELLSLQTIEFVPSQLDENALKELELKMWRLLDTSKIATRRTTETSTATLESIEVPYIG